MSIGRVELIDGNKQYKEYTGGNNAKAESEYVYIERFVKIETILEEWSLTVGSGNSGYTVISAKMYDAVTGEYIRKNTYSDNQYAIKYIPLSFSVIPYHKAYEDNYWPTAQLIIDSSFFAHMGINVDLTQGVFRFTNQKVLSECPILTWFKAYSDTSSASASDVKARFPAFLFRGYLRKLETNDPMYLGIGTKLLDEAESSIY